MEVEFRFSKRHAKVLLIPTNPTEEQQVELVRMYGEATIRTRLGSGKEFVIEFGNKEEKKEENTPQRREEALPGGASL